MSNSQHPAANRCEGDLYLPPPKYIDRIEGRARPNQSLSDKAVTLHLLIDDVQKRLRASNDNDPYNLRAKAISRIEEVREKIINAAGIVDETEHNELRARLEKIYKLCE